MLLKSRSETYRVLIVSGQIDCYLIDRHSVNNNFFMLIFQVSRYLARRMSDTIVSL